MITDSGPAKPANEVITDLGLNAQNYAGSTAHPPGRCPSASACEAYRELIELALSRGRNAMAIWQDLVSEYRFPQ